MDNYDNWKLESPKENPEKDYCCDHCEIESNNEDDFQETTYFDVDRDKRTLWLCETCIEEQIWI